MNKVEYLVHLLRMNRLSACKRGVHSWQHEWHKMQGWCESVVVSFPSSLVVFFRVPFLRALVFVQKTFCDFFLLGFFCCFFSCLLYYTVV